MLRTAHGTAVNVKGFLGASLSLDGVPRDLDVNLSPRVEHGVNSVTWSVTH